MLRRTAELGIFVSAHPDVIMKLGTKEVLYRTRDMPWGSDRHLYQTLDELKANLMKRLALGQVRILKQSRGNGGNGVWKVAEDGTNDALVRIHHARRGSLAEIVPFSSLLSIMKEYFDAGTRIVIDQIYSLCC